MNPRVIAQMIDAGLIDVQTFAPTVLELLPPIVRQLERSTPCPTEVITAAETFRVALERWHRDHTR